MERMRVVLAEDSLAVAKQLRTLLAGAHEVLDLVEDGRALLARSRELRPDLLVTDISMPGMDGLDAAEVLQAERPELRIVFITVHDDIELVERALRIDGSGYVLKADAGEDLLAAIEVVTAGRHFLSRSILRLHPWLLH